MRAQKSVLLALTLVAALGFAKTKKAPPPKKQPVPEQQPSTQAQIQAQASESTPPTSDEQKALRQIEEQIQQLKEDIFKSKTELKNLQDTVLRGKITASKALMDFSNHAEGLFILEEAEFSLDGKVIYRINAKASPKKLPEKFRIFDDTVPSGDHQLVSKIKYRGSDNSLYSAISDFKNHEFNLESTNVFTVDYGKTSAVNLQVLDKGYFKSNFSERLKLDFQVAQDWSAAAPE